MVSLGSLLHDVELNQEVCKGKEIAYFMKIYLSEESGDGHGSITRLLLRGPFIDGAPRGLAQPLPFVG